MRLINVFFSLLPIFCQKVTFKVIRIINPKKISNSKANFSKVNSTYWIKNEPKTDNLILVEGIHASSGPNYLLRTGLIAKALEAEFQLKSIVLVTDFLENEIEKKLLYASFGITSLISIKENINTGLFKIVTFIKSYKISKKCKEIDELLKLEHKGILYGDLLYDTVIKNEKKQYYVNIKEHLKIAKYILLAISTINAYEKILNKKKVKFLVTTHSQYLLYGLMLRVCFNRNIPILETTDMQLFHFEPSRFVGLNPKFHIYNHQKIEDLLPELKDQEGVLESVNTRLCERFYGKFEQSDVTLAYRNKHIYSSDELRNKLDIHDNLPFVFVFAHVFSDAPQGLSDGMLFSDFYIWLKDTIDTIKDIKEINWIIKPHPSALLYNETGEVEQLVRACNSNNIYICPFDFSTASIITIAHAIVTAQGTVGLEYSCFGIPVILAGKPFYAGFGFTFEPFSKKDYFDTLKNISGLSRLTSNQIDTAKYVYEGLMRLMLMDNRIIDSEVLFNVWEKNGIVETDKAFDIVSERLLMFAPQEHPVFAEIKKIFSDSKYHNEGYNY
ncbi:MAG: hypothetical protein IPJ16_11505 [Bacteroidales bacterium]|nr:hypothetical protein [Bacteroidales bacterium]